MFKRDLISQRRRRWLLPIVLATAAAASAGAAFAFSTNESGAVRTASEVYTKEMPLETVSKLSQGKPGQVAPPCPDEAAVNELKAKNLPIGPCDPFPESDQPFVLPKASDPVPPSEDSSDARICAKVLDGPVNFTLPCAVGLQLLDSTYPTVNGERCVRVSWIPTRDAEAVIDTLCPSRPIARSGAQLAGTGVRTPASEAAQ